MTNEASPPASGRGPGYEVRDTNVRAVVTFLVGLTLFVVVVQVFLWGLLRGIAEPDPRAAAPPQISNPAQVAELLHALREREDAALAGKTGGLSVDDALRRLAEQGIPPTGAGKTEADLAAERAKSAGAPAAPTTTPASPR